jgi:hypothetical protein
MSAVAIDPWAILPHALPEALANALPAALPRELPEATQERLSGLRRLLAEKYPAAERKPGGILPTGLAPVDAVEGGLRRAALTELSGASGAGALFIHAMLRAVSREKCLAALVDAARSFDPEGCAPAVLTRLLVVLCEDPAQAVKAVDLLLRDGNLSLVLLDLQSAPLRQIRRIHASAWHRLQRLVEQTTSALVVLTPQPMVEGARVRIAMHAHGTLSAQRRWRQDLVAEMSARVFPRHCAALGGELGGAEWPTREERVSA